MIFAFLAVLFSSIEMMIFGHVFGMTNPLVFVPLFYAITTMFLMIPFFINKTGLNVDKKHRKDLFYYGLFGAIGGGFWFSSIYVMGVSGVAILSVLHRLFIVSYGVFKLGEKMTFIQSISTFIVLCCIFVFSQETKLDDYLGFGLCLFSYAAYALSDISQKKISGSIDWEKALLFRQLLQFLLFFALAIAVIAVSKDKIEINLSADILLWTFIVAIIGGVIAKILQYKAVKVMPLSRYTLVEQWKPFIVFLGGVFVLNEEMSNVQLYSGITMILFVLLILREDKRIK